MTTDYEAERRAADLVGQGNLDHVLDDKPCIDPDCEIHQPEAIEGDAERYTAKAWFLAGALAYQRIWESEGDPDIALDILKARYRLDRNWP